MFGHIRNAVIAIKAARQNSAAKDIVRARHLLCHAQAADDYSTLPSIIRRVGLFHIAKGWL
jgi:GDP-D-mannose dehydratase